MEFDESQPLDIMAVGAHPDDVEVACGGTLAKLVQQGYRVGIVDLTDGEPTPGCPDPEIRLAEAKAAANVLGVHQRITLELPNRRLFDCFEARVALAIEFRRWRPKVVIGFGDKTPLASPDHWQAMLITDAAIFYSRLTKWDAEFKNLPVHHIEKQLYFRLPFESETITGFNSQFLVDITETIEKKIESIACYQTQFPPEKAGIYERVRSSAVSLGTNAGIGAAESFVCAKPLTTQNMMKFLTL